MKYSKFYTFQCWKANKPKRDCFTRTHFIRIFKVIEKFYPMLHENLLPFVPYKRDYQICDVYSLMRRSGTKDCRGKEKLSRRGLAPRLFRFQLNVFFSLPKNYDNNPFFGWFVTCDISMLRKDHITTDLLLTFKSKGDQNQLTNWKVFHLILSPAEWMKFYF